MANFGCGFSGQWLLLGVNWSTVLPVWHLSNSCLDHSSEMQSSSLLILYSDYSGCSQGNSARFLHWMISVQNWFNPCLWKLNYEFAPGNSTTLERIRIFLECHFLSTTLLEEWSEECPSVRRSHQFIVWLWHSPDGMLPSWHSTQWCSAYHCCTWYIWYWPPLN